ncbi:tryptophan--tRNA ligase [Kitasatospora sp. NPDC094019]|uniref:tryptophan--tRNA ligase n=1 Tax=Kitasatospora sp. NPDC094019 TaxID=3364091 RepID=UPI003827B240
MTSPTTTNGPAAPNAAPAADPDATAAANADPSAATVLTGPADLDQGIRDDPAAHRVLTGDRPTGPLHLGHYFGSLRNRVHLQRLGVEMFLVIPDYQVITDRDLADHLAEHTENLVVDYLATGIDADRATIFTHSSVPALNQLLLPFLSLVSVAELHRNPTVKDEIAHSSQAAVNGLMLTYPVHQAADILFCKADLVPVGKDQLPHLEIARTVARRFNERYPHPDGTTVFPRPRALLSAAPLLLGTDGGKMSKSRGNSVPLAADEDTTARLLKGARTDTERRIGYDPVGRPEVSNLLLLAGLCQDRAPEEIAEEIGDGGAAALKRTVTEAVNEHLRPIRARRAELAADRGHIRQVLRTGSERANAIADATLTEVRAVMGSL